MLSRDYPETSPEAEVIRQSGATVMYPDADTTIRELCAELQRILRRLCRATGTPAPPEEAVLASVRATMARLQCHDAPATP